MQYNLKTQPIFKDRKLLRDYQLESLNWLITSWYAKRNVILADEMGLGKTIQTIAFLHHLIQFENCRGPFLVIAPLSTLEHWKRTGSEWTNLNCVLYYDTNSIEGRTCCRAYEWLRNFYIFNKKLKILLNFLKGSIQIFQRKELFYKPMKFINFIL